MAITSKICVNTKKDKHSHILLYDAGAPFSSKTKVKSAKDTVNLLNWKGTPKYKDRKDKKDKSERLVIRLKTLDEGEKKKFGDAESGMITITLDLNNDGMDTMIDVPVDYADDDEN